MKKIKILLIALILILGGAFLSNTYAAETTRNLKAQLERPFNPKSKYQYTVSDNLKYTIVKIYDENDKEGDSLAYTKALYCLRGGVGFGSQEDTDVSQNAVQYTEIGEMHKDAKAIMDKMKQYKARENGSELNLDRKVEFTISKKDGSSTQETKKVEANLYNAILWILDEAYLPKDITKNDETVYDASEYKKELLDKAGIPTSQQSDVTDNDIEVIQQLALWYFTNYDEQEAKVEPTVSQATMFPAQFLTINDNNNIDDIRENNLDRLYQYFIYGAIENAGTYTTKDESTGEREKTITKNEFDKSVPLTIKSSGDYYEVGPIKFKNDVNTRAENEKVDVSSIVLYDANGEVIPKKVEIIEEDENPYTESVKKSGGVHVVYKFVDNGGQEVTSLLKGQEYKIMISKAFDEGSDIIPEGLYEKFDMSKITVKVTSTYNLSTATFLSAGNNTQPVVEIEKEKLEDGDTITTEEFDLSLRKFITSIKRGEQDVKFDDRTPKIDVSKLNTNDDRTGQKTTTATYTHPKNALLVETGDKVVYTIRVYNEGEIDGIATEITDYLPDGLEFVDKSQSSINTTYNWTVLEDGKTITTDYLKETNIKAYDSGKTSADGDEKWQKAEVGDSGLYYADVQVECKVVAQVGASDQNLRNIAAITEDNGEDRDSVPGDPGRTDYNPPADNSTYKEDDDDYEDLVLKAKEFDLSLRKFITKVERPDKTTGEKKDLQIASRVPSIQIQDLKNGNSDTARYVHPKNILSLKRGDIITYTIRVYNEGELDGYAKEVKDYLPEGLELVENENDEWTQNEDNTISTTSLSDKLLKAYDKNKTAESDEEGWQKASDDNTGLYYYDLTVVCKIKDDVDDGTVLKNVAEISIDESKPTDIDDRDSTPDNVYDDDEHNPQAEVDGYTPGEQDDDDFERVTVESDKVFDLALRKYIVAVNETNLEEETSRIPNINTEPLKGGETTADYNHKKDPVEVEVGDIVTYRFSVYNEGELDGYVNSIVDYLPVGLTFVDSLNTSDEYEFTVEGNKLTITPKTDSKLFELSAFDGSTLDSEYIDVKFKVTASESNADQILTNVATMTYEAKDSEATDRDSSAEEFKEPSADQLLEGLPGYKGKDSNKEDLTDPNYHYEGQQDDDDFEKLIIKGKPFDLSLRKYISSIKRNGEEVEIGDRTPKINTETLINGTFDRNGNKEYTATYEHSKEPLIVKKGDIITYTLRIYNEGARDGYATEITDYIPEGLALILNYNTNFDNGWKLPADLDNSKIIKLVGEDGFYKTEKDVKGLKLEDFSDTTSLNDVQLITGKVAITTTELDNQLLKAFDKNKTQTEVGWQKADIGDGGLYYKDVQVSCLVIAENTYKDTITNVAEISEDKDKEGKDVTDRDSVPNDKKDPYTTWQEDDDDYEPVVLKYFDLALRKFITGVETNGKTENVTSRIPNPKIGEDGNIVYEHGKDPVAVANNDVVVYTLRVYNEGTLAGYAEEITDDIPEGLIYLPDHDVNKQYEWKMYDADGNVTDKAEEAVEIKTEYLSEAKGKAENRDNLIDAFDSSKGISTEKPYNPDYRDVKVAFRVTEPNTSDRILVNSAQISKDSDDDEDSDPGKWNEGEDDQDKEYVYVKYFDLSLLKWVTKTIVTVDGKTTTTETGFKPNTGKTETEGIRDNKENEPVAKVELDRKKLDRTTVKFVYKIRVTNEGEIAGYATEITDFIPVGLEFREEDNKKYGWVKKGDDKVTTRALETVLLEPGESAEVEIIFTWKKDKNNLGLKTNIAEITEDYNEHNSKDIDSTPNNKQNPYEKEQEDDDDFALVILSLKTGKGISYTLLITAIATILTGGIYLIKKYVLRH